MTTTRTSMTLEILDRSGHAIGSILSGLLRILAAGVKHVQFGQMLSVLNRLSDEHLAQIGVRRPDIPAYARRLIFDDT